MEEEYINRECPFYDWGRSMPRAYGAFCEIKNCGVHYANCKECNFSEIACKNKYCINNANQLCTAEKVIYSNCKLMNIL